LTTVLKGKYLKVACIAIVAIVAVAGYTFFKQPIGRGDSEALYVGVTYGGNSVEEAKQLIDKVKDYTNLFVLQASLIGSQKTNQICTYAANADMSFIVYFGNSQAAACIEWLKTLSPDLQKKCLGVYFGDELGGKMLDDKLWFLNPHMSPNSVYKYGNRTVSAYVPSAKSMVLFQNDGSLVLWEYLSSNFSGNGPKPVQCQYTTYYPNGSIIRELQAENGSRFRTENFTATPLSLFDIWSQRPFQTYDEAAKRFVQSQNESFSSWRGERLNVTLFTADYALYWYDFQGGYDTVFAEVGWNHTLAQDIALVRGAANMQNKNWGGIITWKYTQAPYLDSGDAIYNQMSTLYETGAKYIIVFNYAPDMTGAYGTLQDQHFDALKRFWNNVVQNSEVKQGSVKAEAVLVLPHNYGWGMRRMDDTIWGLWASDEKSTQIWTNLQDNLGRYGTRLDIVYEDEAFPVAEKYSQICYWNQTK
jgi:hypothetical protein